jgi:tricorn protease
MTVDHDAEREQKFQEAWRVLENGFYDPDFHGVDWDSVRTTYKPWTMQASTTRDFADLMNWMLGEVNASHMGYYARSMFGNEPDVTTGRLGVEVDPVEDGVEVQRVIPRSPADREVSTLREGDVIVGVNGRSVSGAGNFYRLLNGTAGEKTLLEVRSAEGETRSVRIRPTDDLGDELYREWTENRAELVEEYSDGRLGYIHIEGMNWSSFERFERELVARASGKEGLIVDVRYNGGGWTTDYLMTVLDVRRHAYTIPRGAAENLDGQHRQFRSYYPFGERRPFAAWTKPVAALANQNSYSNAEIFSHAFKQFDLGPLVGTPTFGAVISTGGARLIDGSYVRLPFRGWYVYESNQNMENNPAVPDITVENEPNAKALGQDAQLKRAVDELLNQIDNGTARSGQPDRSSGRSGR